MGKVDIRKHASATTVHYAPVGGAVFTTDIARLRAITLHGRALLDRAPEFCRMERTILARLLAGKPVRKSATMAKFDFPGRMFNAAKDSAKGMVDSVRACAVLALDGTREALVRALVQYTEAETDPARQGELNGRRRRISVLVEQEARHEQLVLHPKIFLGAKEYAHQGRRDWKNRYVAQRDNHLSANGGADEMRGNSTLRITLGPTEVIKTAPKTKGPPSRLWQWFILSNAKHPLAKFRLWADEAAELIRLVQANACKITKAPVEVWFDAKGKKISDNRRAKMLKAGEPPASVRQVMRTVTKNRYGLTIDLRRQATGHWYIHVSRKATDLPAKTLAPVGWLGVDLNCDSIARAAVTMRDGSPVLGSYGKDSFPAGGPAGARRTRLFTIINALVAEAKARNFGIALEYLDFEHCKRWLKTKLGAMLHVMPYRAIRAIFERRCLAAGVPLRYVPPKYSSLLGALISAKWTELGRDQAASAVIALRASEAGNPWLETACEQAVKAERVSLRLNAKGKFGHTLVVAEATPRPTSNRDDGRQLDSPMRYPVEPALKWQVSCGRKIKGAFSTLADLRSASLRDQRRAAKAQKCSSVRPHFEMPTMITLDTTQPPGCSPCSSLRKVA